MTHLDSAGYFERDGRRFFAVGVNYWPASTGLRMWENWNEAEVAHDLKLVASLGLNTVRFFLRWQDFEPTEGVFDERQFSRLDWLLGECEARGLCAHPSLFVGWMSGGIYWPPWKGGRNAFNDPVMLERADAFARRVACVFAGHAASLLAVDLGNELDCLPDSDASSRADIANWCRRICSAVRDACPGVLIVSGCDHSQVIGDTPWTFDNQPGTSFFSMHAYPVPAWHPVPLGGLSDPLTERLFAFYCAVARVHGPVLLQEYGSFLTQGSGLVRRFLRRTIEQVASVGVNGMLWWCLHDITDQRHPYAFNGSENSLGLVDAEGCVKPGMVSMVEQLVRWARSPETLPGSKRAGVSLYLPDAQHSCAPESLRHPNPPAVLARRLLMAWHLACECGITPDIVRSDRLPEPGERALLLSGVCLESAELTRLSAWVRAGGHLVWHGLHHMAWGPRSTDLLGARPVDYALATGITTEWAGETWTIGVWPEKIRLVVQPLTASVLAHDSDGHPVLLRHALGRGHVTCAVPCIEDVAREDRVASLEAGDRWHRWLGACLSLEPVPTR